MVRPVEFESTTTGLKGRCSTIELRTHWEQVMDLNHRSSRYERDEIDHFSNLLKFKERHQLTTVSLIVKGFSAFSALLPSAEITTSKEREHSTTTTSIVKGFFTFSGISVIPA